MTFWPSYGYYGAKYVALNLELKKSNFEDFDFEYNTGIMGNKEEENVMSTKYQIRSGCECDESYFGYIETDDLRIICHDELFNSERNFYNFDSYYGRVHLICDVSIKIIELKSPFNFVLQVTLTVRKKQIDKIKDEPEFKRMFENDLFVDIEIKTSDDEILKASKSVLSSKSPVFFAMLTSDMQETKESTVNVPDFNSKIIKELLRFIYCEEVENIEEIDSELIFAAEKYQIDELKEMCIDSMITTLSIENVIETYAIADLVSKGNKLLEHCIHMIAW